MTLQILIPQYEETDAVIKPLLDSIALQQNVDFGQIGVIICNDGSETYLSDALLASYPFRVDYHKEPHRGVSGARNACLDYATADYIMFCDADDLFFNACGLWILFREMALGFDSLDSAFVEETRAYQDIPEQRASTGEVVAPAMRKGDVLYITHDVDSTFVHGKVHRRKYLIDKGIRWNNSLTIHEDSYFNILCQSCSENVKYCPTPFYLWRWRDNSVCRHDPKYILKTYPNMLDSNDALLDQLVERGMPEKARFYAASMFYGAYYAMNKPEWINQENRDFRLATELRFQRYYKKYKELWASIPASDKIAISNQVRSRSITEGMEMECITIDAWLDHILMLQEGGLS